MDKDTHRFKEKEEYQHGEESPSWNINVYLGGNIIIEWDTQMEQ